MGWLKNSIVLAGSLIATVGSILWGIAEGGYEPWIVAMLCAVGILVNLEIFPIFSRKKRNLTPEQKIAARDRWRPVFERYFLEAARNGQHIGDTIIHDVNRLDTYPKIDDKKGISPWFRVGLAGTYNRGILLGLKWAYIEQKDNTWVENKGEKTDNSLEVALLGEVPYESIESVNFDGDDYYNKPHIYCHFEHNGEPYERLFFGEECQLDPNLPSYYREIAKYEPVSRRRFWQRG